VIRRVLAGSRTIGLRSGTKLRLDFGLVEKNLARFQERGVLTVDRAGITLHRTEQLQARLYGWG
jgi:hypothetical protein